MEVYRIKDWDKHFENNRTRELKDTRWVPIPNKQDGDGYTELKDHPQGAAHYGVWIDLVLLASKCEPRGTLVRDGNRPHTPETISRIIRSSVRVIKESLERLVKEVKWMEVVTHIDVTNPAPSCDEVAPECGLGPQEGALNGMEWNGRIEGGSTSAKFVPPSVPEVAAYCAERGSSIDPERFVDHYQSKGWMIGKNKMKDWRAALRGWEPPKPKSKCPDFNDLLKPGAIQ